MKLHYVLVLALFLLWGCSGPAPEQMEDSQILASGMCPSIQNYFFFPDWVLISFLAMAASASLLALLFLLSRFFGNEAGEAHAKMEVYELGATVVIMFIVIALINGACGIRAGALLGPEEVADLNLFDAAAETLDKFSYELLKVFTLLHTVYIPFDFLTTATLTQRPLGMGTEFQPTAGIGAVMKPAFINSLQMIAIAFVVVRAQLLVLDFSTFAMLKFYLPLGIILRSFTPTRRIGGTLIGLTLGLVLIYPYLIVLNGLTIFSTNPFDLDSFWDDLGDIWSAAAEPYRQWEQSSLSVVEPVGLLVLLKALITTGFGGIIGTYYALAMRTAAVAFLIGIFFPALNTLILVTTIRYLTKAFGEEIDVTSLTRMI